LDDLASINGMDYEAASQKIEKAIQVKEPIKDEWNF